jgi:hypothetical protein
MEVKTAQPAILSGRIDRPRSWRGAHYATSARGADLAFRHLGLLKSRI